MTRYLLLFALAILMVSGNAALCQHTELYLHQGWEFAQEGKAEWLPASVPGNVHMDLLDNKKIEDPFFRMNEKDQQWIQDENWVYKTTFDVSDEVLSNDVIELVFEGLDTYAKVLLNGQEVINANNMFRVWRAEVKSLLKSSGNQLQITFRSPIAETIADYRAMPYTIPVSDNDQAEEKVSVYTRKAGYHYGWDWGPRFVTCGVWKAVYLDAWKVSKISDVWAEQVLLNDEKAQINAHMTVDASSKADIGYYIKVDGRQVSAGTFTVQPGTVSQMVPFTIDKPELWWPNGLGDQKLYKISVSLTQGGKVIDEKEVKIGLRNIKVVREPNADGDYSFTFEVNGHPVFMKGANYIPQDNFLNRVDDERYLRTILSAKEANMNMLRIWGGGIYEVDKFYDLCDEHGILLWQDFMFACAMFPGSPDFLDNIRQEAADNVKRLRNHPSIALWCGNNEILGAWNEWGWKGRLNNEHKPLNELFTTYEKIFYEILPHAVAKYDGGKYYWPSSPSANYTQVADLKSGDVHYWNVWHGKVPYEEYEENIGRFMSEYGFQAFPPFETVKTYTEPQDYDIESEIMLSHQRHPVGNPLIREYMQRDYNTPKDFESFLYMSNVLQADIITFAIEAHRRAMPWCMGSLYWQLNDCWPVASWAGIDYYGRWKALHYAVRNSYTEVLVSPKIEDDVVKLFVISDRLKEIKSAKMQVEVYSLKGKLISSQSLAINIKPNTSDVYGELIVAELLKGESKQNVAMYVKVSDGDNLLSENTLYFGKPKELNFVKTKIDFEIEAVKDGFEVTCSSDVYAPKVFLSVEDGHNFTDNYFDLLPGKTKTVKYTTQMELAEFKKKLSIRSLMDAF